MSSHKQLANWYNQLAQHLEAGIPLNEAIGFTEGPPKSGRLKLQSLLTSGCTIDEAMQQAPKWLPHADRIFIATAADTGRLPQTFLNLSERHKRIAGTQAKVIFSLIYPVGVFHLASFALPLMQLIDFESGFEWDPVKYFLRVFALLTPMWLFLGTLGYLAKSRNPILSAILRRIPILAKYSYLQSIADFSDSLANFIDAGLPMSASWQGAVHIANHPRITKAYLKIRPVFDQGDDPGKLMKDYSVFPADLVAYYQAGQRSGKLDQTLHKASVQFQDQAKQALSTASIVYPTLLFALVAGFIIYSIFQVYGSYLNNIIHIMD